MAESNKKKDSDQEMITSLVSAMSVMYQPLTLKTTGDEFHVLESRSNRFCTKHDSILSKCENDSDKYSKEIMQASNRLLYDEYKSRTKSVIPDEDYDKEIESFLADSTEGHLICDTLAASKRYNLESFITDKYSFNSDNVCFNLLPSRHCYIAELHQRIAEIESMDAISGLFYNKLLTARSNLSTIDELIARKCSQAESCLYQFKQIHKWADVRKPGDSVINR